MKPEVTLLGVRGSVAELRIGDRTVFVPFTVSGSQVSLALEGETYTIDLAEKSSRGKARHHDHSMSAPMPGVVLKILATAGQTVTRGTPLIILEAMKMEHQIVASRDGTIQAIRCKEGELVQPGADLIELQ